MQEEGRTNPIEYSCVYQLRTRITCNTYLFRRATPTGTVYLLQNNRSTTSHCHYELQIMQNLPSHLLKILAKFSSFTFSLLVISRAQPIFVMWSKVCLLLLLLLLGIVCLTSAQPELCSAGKHNIQPLIKRVTLCTSHSHAPTYQD